MSFVNLYLSHPEYLSDDLFHARRFGQPSDRDKTPSPDLERLRKHTDVQVMQRGVELRGRVVDGEGRPIPGSEVCWFEDQNQLVPDVPKATTAADGGFRFAHVRPGKVRVLAKAARRAPGLVVTQAAAGAEPIEIRLTPGRPVAGRVADPQAKPIEGAFVNVYLSLGYPASGASLRTDRDGRFRSDEAPSDAFVLGVSQPGYLPIQNRSLVADGKEVSFALTPSLQIAGRVRDETTKKAPSQHVEVEIGVVDPKTGEAAKWGRDTRTFVSQGRFQAEIDATRSPAYKLRITAVGYEPFVSRSLGSREGYVNLDVNLKKLTAAAGAGPSGIVRAPDSKPLADAQVVVSQGGRGSVGEVWITRGKVSDADQHLIVTTGADGRFSLPPLGENCRVLAFTDAYFAIAPKEELEKSHELKAQPWGRVEGQLFVGSKPGAGHFVDLHRGSELGFNISDKVQTDADGRFLFPQVLPGYAYFFYGFTRGQENGGSRGNRIVSVKAGQTVRVTLGGKGRAVVGRLAPPPDFGRAFDFSDDNFRFRIEINKTWNYFPAEAIKSKDVVGAMFKASRTAGEVAYRDQFIQINLRPRPDGSFRVDDLPAGAYRCTTYLTVLRRPEFASASGRRISELEHFFTVPDMAGGRSDEPLDLGTIALRLSNPKPPGDGDVAPPFAVTTLDGKPLRLTDYRGKLVLLNFWAPWNNQSLFQIPYLKDVANSFPADRFAIVNLIPDADPAESRTLAAEVGLPGALGFLGQWSTSPVIKEYEVDQLPTTFLIGTDGKILQRNRLSHSRLWMTQFKDEVAKAIKK
jgi:peroxiredoxin